MPINQSIVTTLKYDAALKVKNQASKLLREAQKKKKKNQKLAVGLVHFTLRISKKKKKNHFNSTAKFKNIFKFTSQKVISITSKPIPMIQGSKPADR